MCSGVNNLIICVNSTRMIGYKVSLIRDNGDVDSRGILIVKGRSINVGTCDSRFKTISLAGMLSTTGNFPRGRYWFKYLKVNCSN